ncbi:MAG: CDP-alcohol phosphatidyltransferase family protein [archaeon]
MASIDKKKVYKKDEEKNYVWIAYRTLALPFIKFFMNTKITPNAITITGAIISFISVLLFYLNLGLGYDILAFFIYQFSIIFDFCDGSIARLKKMSSVFGHFLDGILDTYRYFFLHFAVVLRVFTTYHDVTIFYFFALYLLADSLVATTGNLRLIYSKNDKEKIKVKNVIKPMNMMFKPIMIIFNNINTLFDIFFSVLFILVNFSPLYVKLFFVVLIGASMIQHFAGSLVFYKIFRKEEFPEE